MSKQFNGLPVAFEQSCECQVRFTGFRGCSKRRQERFRGFQGFSRGFGSVSGDFRDESGVL